MNYRRSWVVTTSEHEGSVHPAAKAVREKGRSLIKSGYVVQLMDRSSDSTGPSHHSLLRCLLVLAPLILAACQAQPVPQGDLAAPPLTEIDHGVEQETPAAGSEGIEDLDPFDASLDTLHLFQEGLIEQEYDRLRSLGGASVYRVDLRIGDDPSRISGRLQVHYTNQEDDELRRIPFRVYPALFGGDVEISAVRVGGQPAGSSWDSSGSVLWVLLDAALQTGEALTIGLDFDLQLPLEMSGNYGLYGYFDDVLVLNGFLPLVPVFDEDGWNVDVPSQQGDVSYFDASFFLVRVVAPEDLTVASSGTVVGSSSTRGHHIQLIAAGPAREFYMAASRSWQQLEKQTNGVLIHSYAPVEIEAGVREAMETTERALLSLNRRLGPYPYREIDLVVTPMQALGMEYPGVGVIAENLFDPVGEIQGVPNRIYLESVVVHEIAHQWFYNVVGNDQQEEPWLDEAMAQYFTYLYYLDTNTPEAAQAYRQSWFGRWDRVDREQIPIGVPVSEYAGAEYSAIVYGRGPLFLEALARELGQGAFENFLRDYIDMNHWGIATTEEFRGLAEEHCGCDLGALFNEWVD